MVSLRRIAATLGTDTHSIKRKAAGLGLPFPRQTTRIYIRAGARTFSARLNAKAQTLLKEKRERLAGKRAANRKKWLSILKFNPTVTHRWLREKGSYGVYLWLLKHDKEWLTMHPPGIKNTAQYRRNVDWAERDRLTAEEVRRAIVRLNGMEGCPKRITVTAIAVAIEGEVRLTKFHLGKLPVTARLVSEAVESSSQYALRCLRWAADCFRLEKVAPGRTKLLSRTGGERNIWKSQPLEGIFESTWRSLQNAEPPLSVEAA